MHLDEALLAQLVDGELGTSGEAVHAHLRGCADCRARLESARTDAGWIERRLLALDHAPPSVTVADIARRAGRDRSGARLRWAAGVVLALGLGGVAWAAPGSPLPGLARRILAAVSGGVPQTGAPGPVPDGIVSPDEAGIAVAPGADLVIVFGPSAAAGWVRVALVKGEEVEVRAPTGTATFTAGDQRILVDRTEAPAEFEVRIPRFAPRVEIRAGAERLFLTEDGRVTSSVPVAGGSYLFDLR